MTRGWLQRISSLKRVLLINFLIGFVATIIAYNGIPNVAPSATPIVSLASIFAVTSEEVALLVREVKHFIERVRSSDET